MQQSYPIQGQPPVATVALTTPQSSNIRQSYNTSTSKCLGATQIAIGISCFILQVVAIAIHAGLYFVGHGIWCGLFFILTGSFGVVAGQNKRTWAIITFMVLSILAAAILVVPLLACASIGVSIDSSYRYYRYYDESLQSAKRTMNGLMIGLALLEGIIAIISASICCGPLCCPGGSSGAVHTAGHIQYDAATGQQVIVVTVPQYPQPQGVTYVQQAPPGLQPGQTYVPQPAPAGAGMAPPPQTSQEPSPPAYNPDVIQPPPYQEKM